MNRHRDNPARGRSHNRGSVYVLILGASLLIMVVGVSGLIAARLTHRVARNEAEIASARTLAVAAKDRGLLVIKDAGSGWRTALDTAAITGVPLDGGEYTLEATDPIDGNLTDSNSDPVVLIGTGTRNGATQIIQVTLNTAGKPLAGSWKQVVN